MTKEQFEQLNGINAQINSILKDNEALQRKSDRIDDYIKFVKDDKKADTITYIGKRYNKVDIKFYMGNPTETNVLDYFPLALENKDAFVKFLKECKKGYNEAIKVNEKKMKELQRAFEAA